jgi:hypothetical protein
MTELSPAEVQALIELSAVLGYVPEVVEVEVFEAGPPADAWLEVRPEDRHQGGFEVLRGFEAVAPSQGPVPLGSGPCPAGCGDPGDPHPLEVHSAELGCWLCDCTYGREA